MQSMCIQYSFIYYMKQVSNILTEEREESGQLEENCVDHDAGGLGVG